MTDRELMQQALHALEGWANYGKWVWPESALEQAKRNTTESITALRERLAQPEQERFLVATIGNWGRVEWADGVFPSLGDKMYSSPPKWVGLTDAEREQFRQWVHPDIIKAIELKLQERNA